MVFDETLVMEICKNFAMSIQLHNEMIPINEMASQYQIVGRRTIKIEMPFEEFTRLTQVLHEADLNAIEHARSDLIIKTNPAVKDAYDAYKTVESLCK